MIRITKFIWKIILQGKTSKVWSTQSINDDESFSCTVCGDGKRPGFGPGISLFEQHKIFEEAKSHLYKNKMLVPMKDVENFLKAWSAKYETTIKSTYLCARRYGVKHGYIDDKNVRADVKNDLVSNYEPETKKMRSLESCALNELERCRNELAKTSAENEELKKQNAQIVSILIYKCNFA